MVLTLLLRGGAMSESVALHNREVPAGTLKGRRALDRWLRRSVVGGLALSVPVLVQLLLVGQRLLDWWPVWAWYPDPGYQYLFASGSIITGGTTDLIYHPGTSFQWLIGLSLIATFVVGGRANFMVDVASRPEFYAQAVGIVLGLLFVAALATAAWRMNKWIGLWPAFVFQLLMLWGLPVITAGRFVLWPESLVLTSAIFLVALSAPQLSGNAVFDSRRQAALLGIVGAVGVTAKVTFFPLLLLPIVLLSWKRLAWFFGPLISCAAVLMIPVYSRRESMQTWFTDIVSNPGRQGQAGSWDPIGNFVTSMLMVNSVVRWFLPVLTLVLALTLVSLLVPKRAPRSSWRLVGAVALPLFIVLASGLKEAEARDFILIIPLIATLASLALMHIRRSWSPVWRLLLSGLCLALAALLAAHGVVQERYFSEAFEGRLNEIVRDAAAVEELNKAGIWASAYNAWTPESSSVFALMWSAGSFNREIREKFPGGTHFDLWARRILHVNDNGDLVNLSCSELQELSALGEVGIIVESPSHIQTDNGSARILLSDATADGIEPRRVGRYFAYPLTGIQCM